MGKGKGKGTDKGTGKGTATATDKGTATDGRLSKSDYLAQLAPMELQLNNLARWLLHAGRRLVVVFEGRDAAGKGGAIAAIADTLNPRQCHVVALPKPSEREQAQWYFQRYVQHLPAAGEMLLLDRSWYNRAGVERVMGYCSQTQVQAFLQQAPVFEKMLTDDGVLLFKYWLSVDQAQQEARFAERLTDPLKRWKLSPIDLQARAKYADYGVARDAMLKATHAPLAPWTVIDFNDQRSGRLALIRDLLARVPDTAVAPEPLQMTPLAAAPLVERLPKRFTPR